MLKNENRFGFMSAVPLTSELKVILAMVALFMGAVFAAMVPKNGLSGPAVVPGTLLRTKGGVSGLDGSGRFGFLPVEPKKLPAQRIAAVLLGYHPAERGENNDIAVYSGPGAKTIPLAVKPDDLNNPNTSEIALYGDFWSGRYAKQPSPGDGENRAAAARTASAPSKGEENPGGNDPVKQKPDSDQLMASAQREGNDSGTIFAPDASSKAVPFDPNSPILTDGFTQKDLLDPQEGPIQPRWQEELAVPTVEVPDLAETTMPNWNDPVSLSDSAKGPSDGKDSAEEADDPLKEKAEEAEESGLLAKENKPVSTLPPLPESSDDLLDNPGSPSAGTESASDPIQSSDPIKSMEYTQTEADKNRTKPVAVLVPEDESKYAGRQVGQLVVASSAVPQRSEGTKVSVQMPNVSSRNQIAPPQPVTTFIAAGGETLDSLARQLKMEGADREYFLVLNREKARTDGTIPAGTVIRVPIVKK